MATSKILSQRQLTKLIVKLRREKKKIVTTNGVFDILHAGHVNYLQNAKQLGQVLIVLVNSDSSVKKIKGLKRPINKQNARTLVLSALECVDYVSVFSEIDPRKILKAIKPQVHVKGQDYQIQQIIEKGIVEKFGGKIVLLPLKKIYSTTSIVRKINKLND